MKCEDRELEQVEENPSAWMFSENFPGMYPV
jgi:hypothetical protein